VYVNSTHYREKKWQILFITATGFTLAQWWLCFVCKTLHGHGGCYTVKWLTLQKKVCVSRSVCNLKEPMKCVHHDLEKKPITLEYFNGLLCIKRAGILLKMILSLAIHHHFTANEIISHICDESFTQRSVNHVTPRRQYFLQSIKWHPKDSTHSIKWHPEDSILQLIQWYPEGSSLHCQSTDTQKTVFFTFNQVTPRRQYSNAQKRVFFTVNQVTSRR
jgi:hypothetical protein